MSARIDCVLFDLDGTLADTAPDLVKALNQLLRENGRTALPLTELRPSVSHGGIIMIRRAFGIDETDQAFPGLRQRFLSIYRSCLADHTILFPGMAQVLDRLEADGIIWGVVTNKSAWLTGPLMQALGLDHRAGCVVCGDTVAQSKPHPAPLLHACQRVDRLPTRTLYIGDARRDILAGHSAGMYTLIAGYGYIDEGEDTSAWAADGLVNTPLEILDYIAALNETTK
ncbi:MAG: HAD-IA family hydrolase [Gammaproteobacteria bacterium]